MHYSPTLIVHICGGTIGLLSGTAAMVFRKGSPRHVVAGRVFVVSMLLMGIAAVPLAVSNHDPNNISGGIFTVYLIGTAWLTMRRGENTVSRLDWLVLLIPLVLGIRSWIAGLMVLRSGATSLKGVPVGMILFMASVMLLAAAVDLRMLVRGGLAVRSRISRHLW